MNDIGSIQNEVLVRLSLSTTVTSASGVTDTILNNWLLEAYRWASAYKKWPFTEGRVSTTYASLVTNEDGYLVGEYPEGWKSDSIRLLKIGGYEVGKREFYKFTKYLEDNASTDDRIFSDYSRRYYVNPNIDVSGTVTAWGQYTPVVDLTLKTEATVFEQDGNDAIVEEMLRYAKERQQNPNEAEIHHQKAKEILEGIWERVQAEQYAYQPPPDDGMFKRFDVLKGDFEGTNENQF